MTTALQRVINAHDKGFQRRKQWPELFDLNSWQESVSYQLIKGHCDKEQAILEIGCLTGHHLILLKQEGYHNLVGIDFCQEALGWAREHDPEHTIDFRVGTYPTFELRMDDFDRIVLFDVIEHVHDKEVFLSAVHDNLQPDGKVLILVPLGTNYCDEGHVNFYPDQRALKNLLQYYFTIEKCSIVDSGTKIFAVCSRRSE